MSWEKGSWGVDDGWLGKWLGNLKVMLISVME